MEVRNKNLSIFSFKGMKRFIFHTTSFIVIALLCLFGIFSFAGGTTDNYYRNFTSPRQNSMALGSSMAQFGIVPKVLNPILFKNSEKKIFNYSFYLGTTYYGPVYLESAKKKLDPNTKDGIFILTVDPWLLSSDPENPESEQYFYENDDLLDEMRYVNMKPNIEYLLFHYDSQFINIINRWLDPSHMYLHKDGWLESDPNRGPRSDYSQEDRETWQYELYKNNDLIETHSPSNLRHEYLKETIRFFKKHGSVYLVRLPTHYLMERIEDKYEPNFDNRLKNLSEYENVRYFSFRNVEEDFRFYDLNHLMPKSAFKASKIIGKKISEDFP